MLIHACAMGLTHAIDQAGSMLLEGHLALWAPVLQVIPHELVAYTDADWAECQDMRRSTSGFCVFLGQNLISWSSNRQPSVSRSSAEPEYGGVANCVVETCWLRQLLHDLRCPSTRATIVYCDNISASYLASNLV